ncbi:DNA replication/repair protein RecF [Thiomicrospira sp. WB1]|uniref:DNA replication/repair protein RecF n=1 Tax=Thiomicrospira sp. WB1 TaxID=1685380 RepID=UPI0007499877|nr:DNA replication/repair protein RecF [Thiomicrospira sp. WB1]KUJ72346.1 DNA recombination protein RecF [Thiomicrospira sp. WB1]
MSRLVNLQLQHFRNIDQAHLSFGAGINVIAGDNAAGKTAVIEALWTLASGRSFRTAQPRQLIQHQQPGLVIFCEVEQGTQRHRLGLSRQQDGQVRVRINGDTIRTQAEMAATLPIQLLTPESHRLLEEGPKARRHYLDWGCFHAQTDFMQHWRLYQRALKQRNRALRQQLPADQVQLWDAQLLAANDRLHSLRHDYIHALTPFLETYCQALMPELSAPPQVSFRPGWPQAQPDFGQALQSHLEKDRKQGFTQYGAHRADMRFRFDKMDAQMALSRGQQKLFVCALLLAQAALYEKLSGQTVIMLIDDLPAELDAHHRQTLLTLLQELGIQSLLTTTSLNLIPETARDQTDYQAWCIENGQLHPLSESSAS